MNTKGLAVCAIAVAVVAILCAAFVLTDSGSSDETEPETRVLTDMYGHEFKVGNVEKTVVQTGMAMRFVSYMGADSMGTIVGSDLNKNTDGRIYQSYFYVDIPDYKYLSTCTVANTEEIVSLDPDLVIVVGEGQNSLDNDTKELIDVMDKLGIPVCVLKYVDEVKSEEYKKQLELLGDVFQYPDRATELQEGTDRILNDISSRMSKANESKNVYIGAVGFRGPHNLLGTNPSYDSMTYLGNKIVNVSSLITSSDISQEIQWDDLYNAQEKYGIDLVLMDLDGYRLVKSDYQDSSRKYLKVDAIRENGMTFILPHTNAGTLHDNTLISAYIIGSLAFPELFSDIDIDDTAKEIWSLFMDSENSGDAVYDGLVKRIGDLTGDASLYGNVDFSKGVHV